ncbi:MAG: UbiD family decarboxylase [Desulfotomaculaceae bacterium]|nr:UbiD family decarboxylase [Desulfotomaculaceae bacterium]
MRTWIETLEKSGNLLHIEKPVDPRSQMGSLLYQSRDKALMFHNLTGCPGWTSIGNSPANLDHVGLAFGMTKEEVVPFVAQKLSERIPWKKVETGPVKEVVLSGDEIDLNKWPAHQAGTKDAGPVIGSGLVFTKDPDTGIQNVSFHRLQVQGPRQTGILMVPRHTRMIYSKYEERDMAMPVSIMIGHHPLYYMAAAMTAPFGVDEMDIAGALMGEPVNMVKSENSDIYVPADAEIIIEAHIPPHQRHPEGPFSEFQDYYVAGRGMNPIVVIDKVTTRRNPIFKNIQNGSETEGCLFHKVPFGASIYNHIKSVGGYVDLRNVLVLPGIFGVAIQMVPRFAGEAKNVGLAALSCPILHPKVVVVVDPDVNIFDYWQVLWAISARTNPSKDMSIIDGLRYHPMDPNGDELVPPGTANWQRVGGKIVIDATKPPHCFPEEEEEFERIRPVGDGVVFLKDFL